MPQGGLRSHDKAYNFYYRSDGDCKYEFQMQYGSIGWPVGATLMIACIDDGSFKVSPITVARKMIQMLPS